MDVNKKLERKFVGLAVFLVLFAFTSFMFGKDQDKMDEKLKTYLQSPQFLKDFKRDDNPQQEVLVAYPKITFYLNFQSDYYINQPFSAEAKQDADARQCDFVANLFEALKAEKPQKRQILKTLAKENIIVENIYRNKYAERLYSTEISIKNCTQWYPKK